MTRAKKKYMLLFDRFLHKENEYAASFFLLRFELLLVAVDYLLISGPL